MSATPDVAPAPQPSAEGSAQTPASVVERTFTQAELTAAVVHATDLAIAYAKAGAYADAHGIAGEQEVASLCTALASVQQERDEAKRNGFMWANAFSRVHSRSCSCICHEDGELGPILLVKRAEAERDSAQAQLAAATARAETAEAELNYVQEALNCEIGAHNRAKQEAFAALAREQQARTAQRAVFMAGYHAHPEAEAPVFKWSFEHNPLAGDRAEHCYAAYLAQQPPRSDAADAQEPPA